MLSQEVHNNITPSTQDTVNHCYHVVRNAQLQSQPGNQNNLVPN
ncbi:hypothetical protein NP493_9039g00000 [Ridgeia piscesae]|uniref:Uncharacterized protein n=1 Tax=Ridgeia piscesae TaxID=27915 RepID=A0AAD9MME2_RIDPI|nr:hypothetical protein NP493_9039g00000 [Ridgeia piscesae]